MLNNPPARDNGAAFTAPAAPLYPNPGWGPSIVRNALVRRYVASAGRAAYNPASGRDSKRIGVALEARMGDDIDTDKIDRAVLALLYLTLHDDHRAWKGHDWDALDRLHEKGFISNPASKAKSIVFSEQGLAEAERLFQTMFGKSAA
jgi:hypothetical protein